MSHGSRNQQSSGERKGGGGNGEPSDAERDAAREARRQTEFSGRSPQSGSGNSLGPGTSGKQPAAGGSAGERGKSSPPRGGHSH
ncbi:hypothetical protein WKR88_05230 [Trinickia caryophylli]|uniref:Uncharacterized protein n=1 Tax=Trinickia caryophylli TaxID=28094 RepID=A0A1X7FKA3_TRICW|nr:hypothetical protein [Trinickia caryophylli]TRX19312.1 hypothetical protein FNF07_14465 [Trinickia caryophylli]WQE13386.1 hypothetical protein U0034_08485 [Trinickia caryophylli]GLU34095.1 hypothetical protein Busp01_39370 [Trinickia caryophylli]SMF53628.1 hypothetical protein SAMN06295900_109135 [Trinickia caryophylli]